SDTIGEWKDTLGWRRPERSERRTLRSRQLRIPSYRIASNAAVEQYGNAAAKWARAHHRRLGRRLLLVGGGAVSANDRRFHSGAPHAQRPRRAHRHVIAKRQSVDRRRQSRLLRRDAVRASRAL